ncbi:MAG: hypothetical protein ACK4IS_09585 [Erythrobacter sp.]
MMKMGYWGLIAAAGVIGLAGAAAPAAAQGTLNPQQKPTNGSCPAGWTDYASEAKKAGDLSSGRGNTCYPKTSGAQPAYLPSPSSAPCAAGYIKSGSFCRKGEANVVQSTAGALIKANPLDRCPVGYFTVPSDGNACTTTAANPPKVRRKGDGECGPGEIDDWGLYCVSDYDKLTRKDAAKGFPDYNAIYQNSYRLTGKQQGARQPDLPEGKEYTPAYFTIFGRVDRDGNPLPGGGAGAAAAAGSAAGISNPVAAASNAAKTECKLPAAPKKKGLGGLGAAIGQAVAVATGEAGC